MNEPLNDHTSLIEQKSQHPIEQLTGLIAISLSVEFVISILVMIFDGSWSLWGGLTFLVTLISLSAWFILSKHHTLVSRLKRDLSIATEANLDAFLMFTAKRDENGRISDYQCTFANHSAEELILNGHNALIGKFLCTELLFLKESIDFHQMDAVLETGQSITSELKVKSPEIKARWLFCKLMKLGDGVAVTLRNISNLKRTEGELIEAERFQAAVIDSVSYAIIATDAEGNIISMNNAAQMMLWYDESDMAKHIKLHQIHDQEELEARAMSLSDELGYPVLPGFQTLIAKVTMGAPEEREWTFIRKDGARLPVRLAMNELRDAEGLAYGYLGVAYDVSEQKRTEDKIRHIALHDSLTGLPNRTLFNDRARVALDNAKRTKENIAIALLDVDRFKTINDSLGHHVGDLLLQEVANRLMNSVRVSDTVARLGGDEFAFIFPNIDYPDGAGAVLKKIIKAFESPVIANDNLLHVSASIGVCVCPNDGDDLATLLRKADTAMYQAKKNGRDNFQFFSPEMEQEASKRLKLENDIRNALERNEFELFYQPLVDLTQKKLVGLEALLRWKKTSTSYVSPMEFIPLAEETGLIVPIGEWVIQEACRQTAIFKKVFGQSLRVAINISPRQFRQKNLISCVLKGIKEYGIEPHELELEITENVLMADLENSIVVLGLLRSLGVHVALDDFGTGYSSLSYLSRFPVDRIKIDQSFTKNMLKNNESASLVKVIVNMGKTLGIPVTAEGIETAEQLQFISSTGCDEAQGYFLGKPMPESTLLETYRQASSLVVSSM